LLRGVSGVGHGLDGGALVSPCGGLVVESRLLQVSQARGEGRLHILVCGRGENLQKDRVRSCDL
jgi:hypothetical protein